MMDHRTGSGAMAGRVAVEQNPGKGGPRLHPGFRHVPTQGKRAALQRLLAGPGPAAHQMDEMPVLPIGIAEQERALGQFDPAG